MRKFRCSQLGRLMTNDRSGKSMGKTSISYLEELVKSDIFGRQKEFDSKYTKKGIWLEDEAIDTTIRVLGLEFAIKNQQNLSNDFITGTPDLILENEIVDVKCSWDCWTFPMFENELPNKDYYWQMQGYMALTEKQSARVVYLLLNTPAELNYNIEDDYSNVPIEKRIKSFTVERNDADIELIYTRVQECRNYITQNLSL
jgi:hypothetical protein